MTSFITIAAIASALLALLLLCSILGSLIEIEKLLTRMLDEAAQSPCQLWIHKWWRRITHRIR